ncbi:MAG TPA: cytochrome c nitrite reductase small subunit [Elusimicrobia bacterium]|nr:cytochrome c nitrite reductase small subunit [Elusimicrobiota bacterium]
MIPEKSALVVLAAALGVGVGVGAYTFVYAKGYSYVSNAPQVCANCHIMNKEHDGWVKSTHHAAAVCNDCHTPEGIVGKYATKGLNGFWHSFYFTTGTYPDNIQIRKRNLAIAQANCRRCHGDIVHAVDSRQPKAQALDCLRCHSEVGH